MDSGPRHSGGPVAAQVEPRVALVGIPLDDLTLGEAVDEVIARARRRERTRVSFVNAHCANVAWRDARYLRAVRASDLVFADGTGMRLAGRLLRRPLRDNVNGTDLFPELVRALAGTDLRLYLLGARPGVAEVVAEQVSRMAPSVVVAGTEHGYHPVAELPALLARIQETKPDILLLAMGVPAQEEWLAAHLEATGATVGLGVGGLFDMFSGRIARAPVGMRRLGIEWIWRLAKEPRRMWRRYLVGNVVFVAHVVRERVLGLPERLRS